MLRPGYTTRADRPLVNFRDFPNYYDYSDKINAIGKVRFRSKLLIFVLTGSITSLNFYKKSHLFSTGEDGTLSIWKTHTWESLRTLRGHK